MVAAILDAARFDATVVVGASGLDGTPVARDGRGQHFLTEACEFRSNFLHLAPQHAAVLNVEPDHFDCFSTDDKLDRAFGQFMCRVPSHGQLIVNGHCARTMRLACGLACPVITFGPSAADDWRAAGIRLRSGCADFELVHVRRSLGRVCLQVPGHHQIDNALAAAALASSAGADDGAIVKGLEAFRGLKRRLQELGEFAGVQIIDDYAHHPTEVAVVLSTVRQMFRGRRLWCVFQPHQASRLTRLFEGFATSLSGVDKLAVADVFRAREGDCTPGEPAARDLARAVASTGTDVLQVHALNDILEQVHAALRPGDVVLTLGAGDVGTVAHALIDRLRAHCAAG
jgi:UDP-N-acetylmuramate--alanine ligase